MKQKGILLLLIAILTSCILTGCVNENGTTDYSEAGHWLAMPAVTDKEVDVFYIYPTAWQKADEGEPNICEIDNLSMQIGSKVAYKLQATAFETVGNDQSDFLDYGRNPRSCEGWSGFSIAKSRA